MIKIVICSNQDDVYDSIETGETTLSENSIVIRRLEEIKQELLKMKYKTKIKIKKIK